MPSLPFQLIQELELNAWPELVSLQRGPWRIRLGGGFTGRANSVTAFAGGADLSAADLGEIEAIYANAGLRTSIKITPLVAPGLDLRLEARGFDRFNAFEFRSMPLEGAFEVERSAMITPQPPVGWVEAFGRLNGRPDFDTEIMRSILARIILPVGYLSLVEDGHTIGVGICVVDRRLAELQAIAVDPDWRGRGIGRRVVSSMAAWAKTQGADTAVLSVAAANEPAVRLYSSLGFTWIADAHYRVKPGP